VTVESDSEAAPDALSELRRVLAAVDDEPVAARVARFEHANEVIARELAQLDELTSG
jgi:hypothetical protein